MRISDWSSDVCSSDLLEAVSDLPVGDETILLVEDDRDVAVFATAALETLGYRVVAASHGPAALAELDKVPHLHLLITDVALPGGMNARAYAPAVQEERPAQTVLFMSSYAGRHIGKHE